MTEMVIHTIQNGKFEKGSLNMRNTVNWNKLKKDYSLEDFYNILCRNKPNKNSKLFSEWDYLESITYEELLDENEHISECNNIIDEIIEFLKKQKTLKLGK